MQQHTSSVRGVTASLAASAFFGAIFLFSGWATVSAEYIFAWRVLVTLACYALILPFALGRTALRDYWTLLRSTRFGYLIVFLLALMVGTQLWLFVWAPAHGHALDASLGFLLLPISLVLGGRFIFKSRISQIQWFSIGLATLAVLIKVLLTPQVSWVTGFIAIIYPVYFMVRRHTGLDHPAGFGVELAVLTPLALPLIFVLPVPEGMEQGMFVGFIALGGALAMAAYLSASRWLSLPLFGMLSYVEPLILVGIALLLGERLGAMDLMVYALLALALAALAYEALRALRRSGGRAAPQP